MHFAWSINVTLTPLNPIPCGHYVCPFSQHVLFLRSFSRCTRTIILPKDYRRNQRKNISTRQNRFRSRNFNSENIIPRYIDFFYTETLKNNRHNIFLRTNNFQIFFFSPIFELHEMKTYAF